MATIGIVGLGLLGSAVAARLRGGGHDVVGHDVVAEKARALEALGGQAAPSAEAVARAAEAVCVVLPSLAAVEDVVLGPRGLAVAGHAGQTIIQMSTISPTLTERLAREVGAKGLAFLDCPISGTSGMVARGDGIIFVGGEQRVFDRWRPVLESVLPRAIYIGRPGQAMLGLWTIGSAPMNMQLHIAFEVGLERALASPGLRYAKEMLLGKAAPKAAIPCTTCAIYVTRSRTQRWLPAARAPTWTHAPAPALRSRPLGRMDRQPPRSVRLSRRARVERHVTLAVRCCSGPVGRA